MLPLPWFLLLLIGFAVAIGTVGIQEPDDIPVLDTVPLFRRHTGFERAAVFGPICCNRK